MGISDSKTSSEFTPFVKGASSVWYLVEPELKIRGARLLLLLAIGGKVNEVKSLIRRVPLLLLAGIQK